MTQKCGLIAVVGAPNAGKSTLVNALVGQKVAIVSPKAQTTRTRLMGIAIRARRRSAARHAGHLRARRRLDRAMVRRPGRARRTPTCRWCRRQTAFPAGSRDADTLKGRSEPKILVLNKGRLTPRSAC
jgi:GTP-binding protein Era